MSEEAPAFPVVDVECYAGYRGEETPRRFQFGERHIEIADIVDSWLGPGHRYFRVQDTQGALYILRYDIGADHWELTWFRHPSTGRGTGPPTRPTGDDSR